MKNDDGNEKDFYRFSLYERRVCVCLCVPIVSSLSISFSFFSLFEKEKKEMAQHEHDYLISYKHNLRIFIRNEERKIWQSRVEFIILINVENVSDAGGIKDCKIILVFLIILPV